MEPAQLDETLQRLSEVEQLVASNLVELEGRPTCDLLRTTVWQGVTAASVAAALVAMDRLWPAYEALRDLIGKARALRGTTKRIDLAVAHRLERMLTGPAVLMAIDRLPGDQRTLLAPSVKETWLSADQLITQMSADYDLVNHTIGALERVWGTVVPMVDRARAVMMPAEEDSADPALSIARDQLVAIERFLVDDPLGLPPSDLAHLEASLDIVQQRRARAAAAASLWAAGLAQGHALVAEVNAQIAAACAASSESAAKIADVALPGGEWPGAARLPVLVHELAALDGTAGPSALARLEALVAQLKELGEAAVASAVANRAPLERRAELRGLLQAYQAKAGAAGRLEDAEVASLLDAAEEELYRAPSNLPVAARLLEDVGAALRDGWSTR